MSYTQTAGNYCNDCDLRHERDYHLMNQVLQMRNKRVDALFAPYSKGRVPGAAVMVIQNAKVLLKSFYGRADIETKIPILIGSNTAFLLASVTDCAQPELVSHGSSQGQHVLSADRVSQRETSRVWPWITPSHDTASPTSRSSSGSRKAFPPCLRKM